MVGGIHRKLLLTREAAMIVGVGTNLCGITIDGIRERGVIILSQVELCIMF